jgi:hypothetical protein
MDSTLLYFIESFLVIVISKMILFWVFALKILLKYDFTVVIKFV